MTHEQYTRINAAESKVNVALDLLGLAALTIVEHSESGELDFDFEMKILKKGAERYRAAKAECEALEKAVAA